MALYIQFYACDLQFSLRNCTGKISRGKMILAHSTEFRKQALSETFMVEPLICCMTSFGCIL